MKNSRSSVASSRMCVTYSYMKSHCSCGLISRCSRRTKEPRIANSGRAIDANELGYRGGRMERGGGTEVEIKLDRIGIWLSMNASEHGVREIAISCFRSHSRRGRGFRRRFPLLVPRKTAENGRKKGAADGGTGVCERTRARASQFGRTGEDGGKGGGREERSIRPRVL